jgi:hypothetical protein
MRADKFLHSIVVSAAATLVSAACLAEPPPPPAPAGLAAALGEPDNPTLPADAEPDPATLDWSVLGEPITAWPGTSAVSAARRTAPAAVIAPATRWNRNDRPDGSAALRLGTRLETDWETHVGVDMGLPADPAAPSPWSVASPNLPPTQQNGSGAAWANLMTPRTMGLGAAFETRVDPAQEQGKLATTFSQTAPFGSGFAVTLQNGYTMTQTVPGAVTAAPTVGATAQSVIAPPAQVWSTERSAQVNVLSTGTSVGFGARTSTLDAGWERTLSAEQRLSDHLSVTGAVTETPTGELSKSLKGGLKFSW